jgi:hypothetical protein
MTGSPQGRHTVATGCAREAPPGMLGARSRRTLIIASTAARPGRRHSTVIGSEGR